MTAISVAGWAFGGAAISFLISSGLSIHASTKEATKAIDVLKAALFFLSITKSFFTFGFIALMIAVLK